MALDLRAELDEARAKQEAAEQAAAAAAQRATVAEAKLEAAGMGPMPKMGPTAEQLVINSTQRIRWGHSSRVQLSVLTHAMQATCTCAAQHSLHCVFKLKSVLVNESMPQQLLLLLSVSTR